MKINSVKLGLSVKYFWIKYGNFTCNSLCLLSARLANLPCRSEYLHFFLAYVAPHLLKMQWSKSGPSYTASK